MKIKRVFETFLVGADLEYLMVDGSIVRVHQHGASKKVSKPVKPKVKLQHPKVSIQLFMNPYFLILKLLFSCFSDFLYFGCRCSSASYTPKSRTNQQQPEPLRQICKYTEPLDFF